LTFELLTFELLTFVYYIWRASETPLGLNNENWRCVIYMYNTSDVPFVARA